MPRGRLPVSKPLIVNKDSLLSVLDVFRSDGRWKCSCTCVCGQVITVRQDDYEKGKRRHCGCVEGRKYFIRKKRTKINTTHPEKARFNLYKRTALKRNLTFILDLNTFTSLILSDCYYCGAVPKHAANNLLQGKNFRCNGIDRKDSNLGYEYDNCVPCCKDCNFSKRLMSVDEFESFISRVYFHTLKRKNLKGDISSEDKECKACEG